MHLKWQFMDSSKKRRGRRSSMDGERSLNDATEWRGLNRITIPICRVLTINNK